MKDTLKALYEIYNLIDKDPEWAKERVEGLINNLDKDLKP
tara:strand:- start:75 stop:194 length:120 start_codon:yes stop_codon:yes gene_type:complete